MLLPMLAGCVASVAGDPASLSGAAMSDNDTVAFNVVDGANTTGAIVVEAAGIETGTAPETSSATPSVAAQESGQAAAVIADMAPATIVPEPAPRDGSGNPLLSDGVALAFASPTEIAGISPASVPVVDPASARTDPASPAEAVPAQAKAAPAGAVPGQPKTFFEILFQRQQARQTQGAKVASLGPTVARPASNVGNTPLPGVRATQQLFGDIESDHDEVEAEADYQVAAVGAMGRQSPNGLRLQTDKVDAACLKPELVSLLGQVERHYKSKPVVTSGYRSPSRNRNAGGARQSLHMQCMAADIQVEGVSKWDLAKYLRTLPNRGGVGTYCRTRSVHIDIGEVRDWHYPCRRLVKLKG